MRLACWIVLAGVAGCSTAKLTADGGPMDAPGATDKPTTSPRDASPGAVTFHLVVPGTESYCDQFAGCENPYRNFRINTADGVPLVLPMSSICWGQCDNTCGAGCLAVECLPAAFALETGARDWNGEIEVPSACGADCLVRGYASPGSYTVQLCATPGALSPPDASPGNATCTNTGPETCGPVIPFTYPSATPIELPLH